MNTFNTTFIPSSQQPNNTTSAPNAFVKAAANPFETKMSGMSISAKSFSPSEFIPNPDKSSRFPLTVNSTFTPTTNSSCTLDDSMTLPVDPACEPKGSADKYKTELCKNWIENKACRYGKKCQFAHGHDELAAYKALANTDEKLRTKNCRTFYQTKQCSYGSRCMFRHEHRHFNQILRHFYVCKLYTVESLFQSSSDQQNFVNTYETGVHKLPIFENIHAQGEEEEEESTTSECASYHEDSSLSFIEMEEDILAFCDPDMKSPTPVVEESELNTTIGSSQESTVSEEIAHKLEGDSMIVGKTACFDIAAQMNQAIEGEQDLSFNSAQGYSF